MKPDPMTQIRADLDDARDRIVFLEDELGVSRSNAPAGPATKTLPTSGAGVAARPQLGPVKPRLKFRIPTIISFNPSVTAYEFCARIGYPNARQLHTTHAFPPLGDAEQISSLLSNLDQHTTNVIAEHFARFASRQGEVPGRYVEEFSALSPHSIAPHLLWVMAMRAIGGAAIEDSVRAAACVKLMAAIHHYLERSGFGPVFMSLPGGKDLLGWGEIDGIVDELLPDFAKQHGVHFDRLCLQQYPWNANASSREANAERRYRLAAAAFPGSTIFNDWQIEHSVFGAQIPTPRPFSDFQRQVDVLGELGAHHHGLWQTLTRENIDLVAAWFDDLGKAYDVEVIS